MPEIRACISVLECTAWALRISSFCWASVSSPNWRNASGFCARAMLKPRGRSCKDCSIIITSRVVCPGKWSLCGKTIILHESQLRVERAVYTNPIRVFRYHSTLRCLAADFRVDYRAAPNRGLVRSFYIVCCFVVLLLVLYIFPYSLFVQTDPANVITLAPEGAVSKLLL